jgi:hypothetical protein
MEERYRLKQELPFHKLSDLSFYFRFAHEFACYFPDVKLRRRATNLVPTVGLELYSIG